MAGLQAQRVASASARNGGGQSRSGRRTMASTSRSARNQSLSFQPLAKRLKAWRAEGSRGKRIPEELWKAAAELARVQGLNRTATELKLNYYGPSASMDESALGAKESRAQLRPGAGNRLRAQAPSER